MARLHFTTAAALCALGLASPTTGQAYTEPTVSFSFGAAPGPSDLDPSIYITTKATSQTFGSGNFTWVRDGYGRASLPEGELKVYYADTYNGTSSFNEQPSSTGNSTVAALYDTLVAGANGTITITLAGHALIGASNVSASDDSWAEYGFQLIGQVYNPGTGGFFGGGGEARVTLDDRTDTPAASVFAFDVGTPGVRKAIDVSYDLGISRDGGTLTLTAWVNAGDRLSFRVLSAARGWMERQVGAYAVADLLHTGSLSVSGSPGMTWTSESGVFLTPVPEPAPLALLAAGLAAIGWRKRASLRPHAQVQARR